MIPVDTPKIWLPPKPAIIRPADHALLERARRAMFSPMAMWAQSGVKTTFAGQNSSASTASSYTLSISGMLTSGQRIIGVLGRAASTRTINSVTLDGVSATALGTQVSNSGTSGRFYITPATSNTTANAVVSLSGSWLRCTVGIWNVLNLISTSPSDTIGTDTTFDGSNQLQASVNVLASGAVYALAYDGNNAGPAFTWTNLTEAFDILPGGASPDNAASGANADFATAQTGLTITAKSASSPQSGVLIVMPMR